ncbi:MAG: hypothetical protein AAGE86_06510 [Pseudomonadota bacterium]
MTATELIAAAAYDAPVNKFSTSHHSQWWVDLLGSVFDGLILLPFALLFVWGTHRLKLNRWILVTAALATVFALVVSELTHKFIGPIFIYSDQVLEMVGMGRFFYLFMPGVLVCFGGSLALAWWRKRNEPTAAFE